MPLEEGTDKGMKRIAFYPLSLKVLWICQLFNTLKTQPISLITNYTSIYNASNSLLIPYCKYFCTENWYNLEKLDIFADSLQKQNQDRAPH